MAKLATLTDDFQDGVIDPALWTVVSGTVAETGGRAKLTPTSGVTALLRSVVFYDATESQVIVHAPVVTANGSTGTLQSGIALRADASNGVAILKGVGNLICQKQVAGIYTDVYTFPYDTVNMLFWRMREASGIFYWDTSANGIVWTNRFNTTVATNLFPVNSVKLLIYSAYSGFEPFPGTFQVESVNPGLPLRASGASTSSGTLALQVSAPLTLTAVGASISSGSLLFTPVAGGSLPFRASGLSTSSGSLTFTPYSAALPVNLPAGTWYFEPPIAYDLPPTLPGHRHRIINSHAKWKGGQRRGRSVLKMTSGITGLFPSDSLFPGETIYPILGAGSLPTYITVDTPTQEQMAAAITTYLGGHIYEVTVQEAFYLLQSGFNVYHGTDLITSESGDLLTTESGDILTAEYSFGS